jgi:SAM-dependent methyltransferase
MQVKAQTDQISLCGAKWAAKSEAYASLISEHLSPDTVWLDAGCGSRLLENDMDPLESWLTSHCKTIIGMDVSVTSNRNISSLVNGSLYELPFVDNSFDLITCRMVVEHLAQPHRAFAESARCLRPGGALVVITPNLLNYGIFGNAIATNGIAREIASPHCPRIRFAGGRRHLSCALQSKHNASPGSVVERFRFASS